MKQKLLALLRTKFDGVDEAILSRIAEKKANGIAEESQLNSISEGISFQDVLTSYGDFRANSATQTAVSNYERKHGIKDGKPLEDGNKQEQEPVKNVVDLISNAISEAVSPLTKKISELEARETQATRNAQVLAKAKEYGIPESLVKIIKIDDNADIDSTLKDAQQSFINAGFKNVVPPTSGNPEKKEVDEIAKMIAQDTAKREENNH